MKMTTQNIKIFILFLTIGKQFSSPMKRNEYEVMLSKIEEKEDYDEEIDDGYSIYESIRDENHDILTKIEKLYTAFKSDEHHHEHLPDIPLLSIVKQEPHTMTIMVKPKEFQTDTLVSGSKCRISRSPI